MSTCYHACENALTKTTYQALPYSLHLFHLKISWLPTIYTWGNIAFYNPQNVYTATFKTFRDSFIKHFIPLDFTDFSGSSSQPTMPYFMPYLKIQRSLSQGIFSSKTKIHIITTCCDGFYYEHKDTVHWGHQNLPGHVQMLHRDDNISAKNCRHAENMWANVKKYSRQKICICKASFLRIIIMASF